jgi:hypothetical protein
MIQRRKLTEEENLVVEAFIGKDEEVNNVSDISYDILHFIKMATNADLTESETFQLKRYIELKVNNLI